MARIFKFLDMSGCVLHTIDDPEDRKTSFRFPYTGRKLP